MFLTRRSSRTRAPDATSSRLSASSVRRRDIRVVHEHDRARARLVAHGEEVDDALEADREAARRHLLAEEAPDHVVVAAAAAERVAAGRGARSRRSCPCSSPCRGRAWGRTRSRRRAARRAGRAGRRTPPGRATRAAADRRRRRGASRQRVSASSSAATSASPVTMPCSRSSAATPVGADLVELVDGDERALAQLGRDAPRSEDAGQDAPVVEADGASAEAERVERRDGGGEQLELGERAGLADDVDVALHELAVAALLRALGAPHRRDLDGAEHGRQRGAVRRVEPGQRHREVVAQAEVGERERVAGCRGRGEVVGA